MLTEFGRGGGIIGQQIHGIGAEMTQTGQALSETSTAISDTSESLSEIGETLTDTGRQATAAGEKLSEAGAQAQKTSDKFSETGDKVKKSGDKVAALGKKFTDTGNKIKGVGENLTSIGGTLTRNVTLPLVGAGAAALTVAANFDEGMSKVQAISGATGEDLEKLRDKAREMGSKTKFSASEAADAMSYMAMAGWKTGDMLDGIEGIMNLAAASGEDLATTSDIVTDALTAFGLKASDSAHFSDILAAASSNANTNVSLMGETFKYVAPVAGALGISAEDTAEAVGLMANAGIKGSQAGTSLRSILTRLATDAGASSKSLGALGVLTEELGVEFYDANGKVRDFGDILNDARKQWKTLSEEDASRFAKKIAGEEGISAWLSMMNAAPEDIAKLSNAISNCDGVAEKMAATMQNNLKGQLTVLKSQAEELAIGFGTQLMPVAQDLVGLASSAVQGFSGLNDGAKKFIVYAGLAAAAAGPLTSVIGSVTSGVGSMITTLGGAATAFSAAGGGAAGLGAAITSIIGPAGWVVLGLGAVTAAGVALYAATRDANKGTKELGEAFKGAAADAKTFYDEVQNGGSVNLTSSFSSELNSGIDMNDLQQKITNTQQKITDIIEKASKERRKLTKKDIKELKKYYDDLKKLHEEQSKYYANNLTALVQAVNDGLELNEESAQEILKQGKANMDAALKAEEQAHNDRITAIEKIYNDDEAARKKAIAQENADYAKHKEEIKSAFADLTSEVTNGYAEQNLAGSEFFEKLKQYNADVEAENKRHSDKIAEIQEYALSKPMEAAHANQVEMSKHNEVMEKLNQQLADNFKGTNADLVSNQLGFLALLQSNHGEINRENYDFVYNFAEAYDSLPDDVRKDMDETIAAMNLKDRNGEIIDSVHDLCEDLMDSFASGLEPNEEIKNAGKVILDAGLDTLQSAETRESVENAGKEILGAGLSVLESADAKERAENASKEILNRALNPLRSAKTQNEAKKSGGLLADKFNIGVESKESDAKKSGEGVANAAVKPMGAPTPQAQAKKSGQDVVTSMTGGMESKRSDAETTAGGIMTGMHTAMSAVSFSGIGGNIVSGILKGINQKKPSLISSATSLAQSAAAAAKRALGINSPSRVMMEVGRFTAEGMELGLLKGAENLYDTASAISEETADALSGISFRGAHFSGTHSTGYGDKLDRLLDAVEKLADSQTTMEIDGRPFGRLVREYV